jgi:uncharacterized damage-inducible protein DinB
MNNKIYHVLTDEYPDGVFNSHQESLYSVVKMLNHLIIVDIIWLKRFAIHPANYDALTPILSAPTPKDPDEIITQNILDLAEQRKLIDKVISEWAHSISRTDLDYLLCYKSTQGAITHNKFFTLIMYFFNYQTHIRGKILALLSFANLDVGATELIVIAPSGVEF